MGFKQTAEHRYGKGSFHQIGLVRGQFGNVPMAQWLKFIQDTGFDGWEEASWELDLDKCGTDQADAGATPAGPVLRQHAAGIHRRFDTRSRLSPGRHRQHHSVCRRIAYRVVQGARQGVRSRPPGQQGHFQFRSVVDVGDANQSARGGR